MNEALHQWLNQCRPVAGLLACGVRHADQTASTRAFDPAFSDNALENAWRCVGDALQVLKHHHLPTEQMRWTYEQALLCCALRPDGACLAVFISNDPQAVDPGGLEQMFAEFQSIDPA